MPTPLPNISPLAWEHPADRAALNALRALPGFDEAVKRILGFFGERGVRYFFLANAVRVGSTLSTLKFWRRWTGPAAGLT